MVETISPIVHGGRTRSYWSNLLLHLVAAGGAAAAIGALLGALGALLGAPWGTAGVLAVLAVAVVYAARDLFRLPVPLPDLGRQVPEWWRTFFSRPVTSILYGLGLGTAFFTSLSFGTFVVVSAIAVVSGSPAIGALICAPFGLGRALVLAAADPEGLDRPGGQRFLGLANGLASLLAAAAVLAL